MNQVKNIVEIAKQSEEVQKHIKKHIEVLQEQVELCRKKITAGSRVEYNIRLLEQHTRIIGMHEQGLFQFKNVQHQMEYFQSDLVLDEKEVRKSFEYDAVPECAHVVMDIFLDKGKFNSDLLDISCLRELKVNKNQFEIISTLNHKRVSEFRWMDQLWCGVQGYGLIYLK